MPGATATRELRDVVEVHGRGRLVIQCREGLTVTLVRPLGALAAHRGMKPDGQEGALDVVEIVAGFEQRKGEPAGPLAGMFEGRIRELTLDPFAVFALERIRQAMNVASVDGGQVASNCEGVRRGLARQLELREPIETPDQRR